MSAHVSPGQQRGMSAHVPPGQQRGMSTHVPLGQQRGMSTHVPPGQQRGMSAHVPPGQQRRMSAHVPPGQLLVDANTLANTYTLSTHTHKMFLQEDHQQQKQPLMTTSEWGSLPFAFVWPVRMTKRAWFVAIFNVIDIYSINCSTVAEDYSQLITL